MFSKIYNTFKIELSFIKEALVSLKNHAGADLKVNGVWYAFIFAILFIFLRESVVDTIVHQDYFANFSHLANRAYYNGNKEWLVHNDQRFMFYLWSKLAYKIQLSLGAIVFIFIFFVYINSILLLYIIELLGKMQISLFIKLSFIILSFFMLVVFPGANQNLGFSAYLSIQNIWLFLFLLFGYATALSFYSNKINYLSSFILVLTGSCIVGSYSAGLFYIYYLLLFTFLYEYFHINKSQNIKHFIKLAIKYLILLILIFCFLKVINYLFVGTFKANFLDWRKLNHLSFLERVKFGINQINSSAISYKYLVALLPVLILIALKITKNNLWRVLLFTILFLSLYVSIITDIFMKIYGVPIRFYVIYIYISYLFLCLLILYRNSKIYLYLGVLVTILNLFWFNNFIKVIEDVQKINKYNNYTIQNVNNEYSKLCSIKNCSLILLQTSGKHISNFYKFAQSLWQIDFNLVVKGLIVPITVYDKVEQIQDAKLKKILIEKSKLGLSYPMEGSIIKIIDENGKPVIIIFV